MRVSIDATPFLMSSAGVKTYIFYWTRYLQRLAGNHRLNLFPYLEAPENCVHDRSMLALRPTLNRLALVQLANRSPIPILSLIGLRADIFHASHQLLQPPRKAK